jgi:CBS domain-containing protein
MRVADIMTTGVTTVGPETSVRVAARILVDRGISTVPVVNAQERLLGIVSEGGVVRRIEIGIETRGSWWRTAVVAAEEVPGFVAVESHLGRLPGYVLSY